MPIIGDKKWKLISYICIITYLFEKHFLTQFQKLRLSSNTCISFSCLFAYLRSSNTKILTLHALNTNTAPTHSWPILTQFWEEEKNLLLIFDPRYGGKWRIGWTWVCLSKFEVWPVRFEAVQSSLFIWAQSKIIVTFEKEILFMTKKSLK